MQQHSIGAVGRQESKCLTNACMHGMRSVHACMQCTLGLTRRGESPPCQSESTIIFRDKETVDPVYAARERAYGGANLKGLALRDILELGNVIRIHAQGSHLQQRPM